MRCEGFSYAFDANACKVCQGHCCTGESGYIWVSPEEIKQMAEYFQLESSVFVKKYLLKVGYRFTLKEETYNDGFCCVFFDTIRKQCSIYLLRPSQCRTFPFWEYFKENVNEVIKECPGIIGY